MKYIIIFSLSVIFLCGCTSSKKYETPTIKPYIGTWDVTFGGTAAGSGVIVVNNNGGFSNAVTIGGSTYTVSGNVDNNGTIQNGKMNNSGSFTGNFNGNAGEGNWSSGNNNGTWQGTKR